MTMTRPADFSAESPVPPACRATVDRLQLVLDGESGQTALDADSHPAVCTACRERIAAARLMLSVLATPPEPIPLPTGMTDAILTAVREDRSARVRRRAFALAGGLAVAAAVVVAVWLRWPGDSSQAPDVANNQPNLPNPAPEPAPLPRPVRIGDELAKAGEALRGSSKPLTEPAAAAPELFVKLTDALSRPALPTEDFEPARRSLAELPEAARLGLEPVTGTAQKAFARLLHDVSGVSAKPKS
jgi:hypothetical protein